MRRSWESTSAIALRFPKPTARYSEHVSQRAASMIAWVAPHSCTPYGRWGPHSIVVRRPSSGQRARNLDYSEQLNMQLKPRKPDSLLPLYSLLTRLSRPIRPSNRIDLPMPRWERVSLSVLSTTRTSHHGHRSCDYRK